MTTPAAAATAREVRRERARRLAVRFALWVCLPTLLSMFYYGCWASREYESVAIVKVQTTEGTADAADSRLVRDYIKSRAMAGLLTERHQFAEHFQSGDVDWFKRLDGDAGPEEIYDYYLDKVTVKYQTGSRLLTVKVRARTGQAAQTFADAILRASQEKLRAVYARAEQQREIVTIAEPSLPDSATYPRRGWKIATVFVVALVFMGIFGLLSAAVREHAKF